MFRAGLTAGIFVLPRTRMKVPKLNSIYSCGGNSLTISGGRAVFETICLEEGRTVSQPSGSHKKFRSTQPLGRQVLKVLVEYFTQAVGRLSPQLAYFRLFSVRRRPSPFISRSECLARASLRYGRPHRSLWQTEMQSGPEKSPGLDNTFFASGRQPQMWS
jgi:hypothetical protein